MSNHNKALTLLELLIYLILLGAVVLAIFSIDYFSRSNVVSAGRVATLQNDVSVALEHMSKQIGIAIGNESINGANTVARRISLPIGEELQVFIDINRDGQRSAATDVWVAYRFRNAAGPLAERFRIRFCAQCNVVAGPCVCSSAWEDVTANRIISFTPFNVNPGIVLTDNFLDIQVTSRWQTSQLKAPDNPEVSMRSCIKMPSISTH